MPKLVDVKFTNIPRNSTMARMIRQFSLPSAPKLMTAETAKALNGNEENGKSTGDGAGTSSGGGLREMEDKDIPGVKNLWDRSVVTTIVKGHRLCLADIRY